MEIGRVCIKTMGRDAGKLCVIIDNLEGNYVMIDGETRRRKCNMQHVEPTKKMLDIKKGADRTAVKEAFKSIGVKLVDTKPKKATKRPVKQKLVKAKSAKDDKKTAKKETKPKKTAKKVVKKETEAKTESKKE